MDFVLALLLDELEDILVLDLLVEIGQDDVLASQLIRLDAVLLGEALILHQVLDEVIELVVIEDHDRLLSFYELANVVQVDGVSKVDDRVAVLDGELVPEVLETQLVVHVGPELDVLEDIRDLLDEELNSILVFHLQVLHVQ